MRRKGLLVIGALVLASAGSLMGAGVASAQTNGSGSSIGPCTPTTNTVDLGSFNVGATLQPNLVPICLFDRGSSVAVTVNGQSVGTKTANATGGVSPSITVSSCNQLTVDDPVVVPAQAGPNNVSATGPSSAAKAPVTVTGNFTVVCPAAGGAVTKAGGLAFTGANLLRWVAIALALVMVGFLMVRIVRRRRSSGTVA
ncbi:MAG: hypothetical protein M3Z84_03190 [Actinomycetota bacterium]|nr:hypothetical protein [Actinomycetota bacterium]